MQGAHAVPWCAVDKELARRHEEMSTWAEKQDAERKQSMTRSDQRKNLKDASFPSLGKASGSKKSAGVWGKSLNTVKNAASTKPKTVVKKPRNLTVDTPKPKTTTTKTVVDAWGSDNSDEEVVFGEGLWFSVTCRKWIQAWVRIREYMRAWVGIKHTHSCAIVV